MTDKTNTESIFDRISNPAVAVALDSFIPFCQSVVDAYYSKQFPTLRPYQLEIDPNGKKYLRIVKADGAGHRSVYCFIDLQTGEIMKGAGWKAPAKTKGSRGNVLNPETWAAAITPYGAAYLK